MTDHQIGRRAVVLGGVGLAGLTLGSSGALAAQDLASPTGRTQPPATEDLMTDHGLLKRILLIYREASHRLRTGDTLDPNTVFHSAQIVHDYIESFHEGIEEGFIFPTLVKTNTLADTVRTLLVQHDRGRKITVAIIGATSAMAMNGMPTAPGLRTAAGRAQVAGWLDAFVTMYEPHEAREDTEVFPAFRQVTTDRQFALISEQVAEAQHRDYGDNAITHFLEQIAGIEKQLGIHDLSSFTPAEPT